MKPFTIKHNKIVVHDGKTTTIYNKTHYNWRAHSKCVIITDKKDNKIKEYSNISYEEI